MLTACQKTPEINYASAIADWPNYASAPGGGHYSKANQITPENVQALEKAWEYRSGDFREGPAVGAKQGLPSSSWQVTPLMIDDTLYACTSFNRMIALDPETGQEKWSYDPKVDISKELLVNCRGVSSWQAKQKTGAVCEHRIIMGTMDGRMIVVDAKDGKPCQDFGTNGQVDLKEGLGEISQNEYSVSSPPAIIGNKIVTGAFVLDRIHNHMPSGVVRAYDVITGELLWYWDPVPPGQEPTFDAQGKPLFKRGTSNVWSIISVDEERDLVFLPTGNTSIDFFGGLRDNLDYYSSSVVALNGSTGKLVWHYQMVHHDIWDFDTPAQPTLFDFERDGKIIPALAQPTKMGLLFLLNRETGEPLFPVEERPVPQNWAVEGEYLSPTQPFPTVPAPLHPLKLDPENVFGFTFWDKGACRDQISALRNDGIYTPPSLEGTVFYPSDYGGNNWDTPAIDPERKLIILNTRLVATVIKLIPRDECKNNPTASPQFETPYCVTVSPLLSPLGAPCGPRPWGKLSAINYNTGELVWERPFGTLEELAPWPISMMQGPPNIGGAALTASGLTFIASTTDFYFRAFNTENGEELWKAKLPTGGHASAMTYSSKKSQKQYVIIAAAGYFSMDEPVGDHLIAYALPDKTNN
ncbi:pyrroloquinoline quinone-dependent dehydrogenase [Halieaceae bacterium]|nr:pyrroloquinoline quinone-dependent dehydrogenase [Halieaceae bacterium]